ncbi:MAG: hypothetical protein PHG73_13090 [Pygmaiobacter sp.]|nr:hypothetical protein [Pygmaiobacter sp.]
MLPLILLYSKSFSRNKLHEDKPYFVAIIVSIMSYSSSVMMPADSIRRACAIADL